jgi:O-antigen ligase
LGILSERRDGRLAGPLNDVNGYGAVLIFIIPVTAGLMIGSQQKWLKRIFGIGTFVGFILLGLTVSRGSYLGLLVGGSLALYLVRDHIPRESVIKGTLMVSGVLVVVAGAIAYVNPEGFISQFDFIGSSLDSASSGRIFFWRQALTMMSYEPISFVTGYGWNSYATLFLGYGDPHNTYLMYWFNLGIVGLTFYLLIVGLIIRFALRRIAGVSEDVKPIVVGFVAGFMSLHVALFFVGLYTPWLFIWAISGAFLRVLLEDHRAKSTMSAVTAQSRDT